MIDPNSRPSAFSNYLVKMDTAHMAMTIIGPICALAGLILAGMSSSPLFYYIGGAVLITGGTAFVYSVTMLVLGCLGCKKHIPIENGASSEETQKSYISTHQVLDNFCTPINKMAFLPQTTFDSTKYFLDFYLGKQPSIIGNQSGIRGDRQGYRFSVLITALRGTVTIAQVDMAHAFEWLFPSLESQSENPDNGVGIGKEICLKIEPKLCDILLGKFKNEIPQPIREFTDNEKMKYEAFFSKNPELRPISCDSLSLYETEMSTLQKNIQDALNAARAYFNRKPDDIVKYIERVSAFSEAVFSQPFVLKEPPKSSAPPIAKPASLPKSIKTTISEPILTQKELEQQLLDFYRGTGKSLNNANQAHYTFEQMIGYFQGTHQIPEPHTNQLIQWLFPLPEFSPNNPRAVCPSVQWIKDTFTSDSHLQEQASRAFYALLSYYGAKYISDTPDGTKYISDTPKMKVRYDRQLVAEGIKTGWLNCRDHNHLRITRALRFLMLIGKETEARAFHVFLFMLIAEREKAVDKTKNIQLQADEETQSHWEQAILDPTVSIPTDAAKRSVSRILSEMKMFLVTQEVP